MATIEQRARAYTNRNGVQFLSGFEKAEYDAYIKGATEQREIDHEEWQKDMRYVNIRKQELIDKACDVYRKELEEIIGIFNRIGKDLYGIEELGELIHLEGSVKDFRKAMEE